MNSTKIHQMLKERCRRVFLGVFTKDQLPRKLPPRRPLLLVCNTDPHDKPGEHWIVMYIDRIGEYFDSFAQEPPRTFQLYLEKHCKAVVTNNKTMQSVISAYCGHYCVFYCLMKTLNYSLKEIVDAFTSDTALNDFIVHRFVCNGLNGF
jgi:hypothetical protein